jgi:pectate lyase
VRPGRSHPGTPGPHASRTVIENGYFENVKDPYYRDATASLTQTGSFLVHCTGKQQPGGTTFRPGDHYSSTLDPASEVPAPVRAGAGPQSTIGT